MESLAHKSEPADPAVQVAPAVVARVSFLVPDAQAVALSEEPNV